MGGGGGRGHDFVVSLISKIARGRFIHLREGHTHIRDKEIKSEYVVWSKVIVYLYSHTIGRVKLSMLIKKEIYQTKRIGLFQFQR